VISVPVASYFAVFEVQCQGFSNQASFLARFPSDYPSPLRRFFVPVAIARFYRSVCIWILPCRLVALGCSLVALTSLSRCGHNGTR
jgi:hypothetical protein